MESTTVQIPPLALIMSGVAMLAGIGSLVCLIMVIVAAFKKEATPNMGILTLLLGLCTGIGAYIVGWVKVKDWDISKVMLIWTICIVVGIVCYGISTMAMVSAMGPALDSMPPAPPVNP